MTAGIRNQKFFEREPKLDFSPISRLIASEIRKQNPLFGWVESGTKTGRLEPKVDRPPRDFVLWTIFAERKFVFCRTTLNLRQESISCALQLAHMPRRLARIYSDKSTVASPAPIAAGIFKGSRERRIESRSPVGCENSPANLRNGPLLNPSHF